MNKMTLKTGDLIKIEMFYLFRRHSTQLHNLAVLLFITRYNSVSIIPE